MPICFFCQLYGPLNHGSFCHQEPYLGLFLEREEYAAVTLSFLSLVTFVTSSEGKEKTGVRIAEKKEVLFVAPYASLLRRWSHQCQSPRQQTTVTDFALCYYKEQESSLGGNVAPLMRISSVCMSCHILRLVQLWDLLPKGSVRTGSFSFEVNPGQKQEEAPGRNLFSAPFLLSCPPTRGTVGKLRTCQREYTVQCKRSRERQAVLVWVCLHQLWSFK